MKSKSLIISGLATAAVMIGAAFSAYSAFGGVATPTVAQGQSTVALASANSNGNGNGNGGPPATMTITGGVSGYLFPGHSLPLVLTITNPNAFPATISSVTVSPTSPSSSCPAHSLTSTSYSGSLAIAGHGTVTVPLTVTMSSTAPNGCQHIVYVLNYAAEAKQG